MVNDLSELSDEELFVRLHFTLPQAAVPKDSPADKILDEIEKRLCGSKPPTSLTSPTSHVKSNVST